MHRLSARAQAIDRWHAAQVGALYRVVERALRPATTAPPLRRAPPTRRLPDTQAG